MPDEATGCVQAASDWINSRPVFYDERTGRASHYVNDLIDFADLGIGTWRFYIFNIADSAVTCAILLMLVVWFVAPHLGVQMPFEEDDGKGDSRGSDDAGSVKVR